MIKLKLTALHTSLTGPSRDVAYRLDTGDQWPGMSYSREGDSTAVLQFEAFVGEDGDIAVHLFALNRAQVEWLMPYLKSFAATGRLE